MSEPSQSDFQAAHITALEQQLEALRKRFETLHEALDEIAFYGTSRPAEMGSEDDGDGWYKRIAYRLIGIAANARRSVR